MERLNAGLAKRLKLPKEHGAWAMLYVPFALGVLVAHRLTWAVLLLALSVTALFVGRESIVAWWRARRLGRAAREPKLPAIIYPALSVLFGAPLVLFLEFFWLAPLGLFALTVLAVNAEQSARFEDRSVLGEFLAIIGLTLTAPAAYYVARGSLDAVALWLWFLSALYFTSSVFYVKLRVVYVNPRRSDGDVRRNCAVYHAFLLGSLFALSMTGSLSLFALVAFAPALARAFWRVLRPARELSLKRVGLLEIAYSAVFLIFIAIAFRPL